MVPISTCYESISAHLMNVHLNPFCRNNAHLIRVLFTVSNNTRTLQGRERVPCLWISIFYNPEGLLGSVMHEAVQGCEAPPTNFEEFNFQTEITNRDKDHVSTDCDHVSTI